MESNTSDPVLNNLPCGSCNSSDAVVLYDDGHTHCFSCENHINNDPEYADNVPTGQYIKKVVKKNLKKESEYYPLGEYREFKGRKLTKETCEKYEVKYIGKTKFSKYPAHLFPFFDRETKKQTRTKIRTKDDRTDKKKYLIENLSPSSTMKNLFGAKCFNPGCARAITVTEGEYDAMSGYQLTGSRFPWVSLPDGASSVIEVFKNNWEYLNSFEKIVLCFDNDEAGERAVKKVIEKFKSSKLHIVQIPKKIPGIEGDIKDANDFLKLTGNSQKDLFKNFWFSAERCIPQNIVLSSQLKERIKNIRNAECFDYPWDYLNSLTYGMRKGEFSLIKARRGVGKTQIVREIMLNLLEKYPDEKLGAVFLEEIPEVSARGLMSLKCNKRLNVPDVDISEKEEEEVFTEVLSEDRIVFYDGNGVNDSENVLKAIEWMHLETGAEIFFLDSLTILTTDHNKDERKTLDSVSTHFKDLIQKHNLHICSVVHENRDGQVRGSDGPENMAHTIISLKRDQTDDNIQMRNTTEVVVEKNRFTGDTGLACYLKFDKETGRLIEDTEMGDDVGFFNIPDSQVSEGKEIDKLF